MLNEALRRTHWRGTARRASNVHEIRKRLKEVRALIPLLASGSRAKWVSHLLRDVGRELSPARNADNALETFTSLRVRRRLTAEAYEEVHACLAGDRVDIDLRTLSARLIAAREEIARWPAADPERFEAVMHRGNRSARKAMLRAIRTNDEADFHQWRKRAKRQWHQTQRLELTDRAAELRKLARALGQHHDLALLRDALARHAGALDAGTIAIVNDAIRRRISTLDETIVSLGTAIFSAAEPAPATVTMTA